MWLYFGPCQGLHQCVVQLAAGGEASRRHAEGTAIGELARVAAVLAGAVAVAKAEVS